VISPVPEQKTRFTLLFEALENVHLHKDVGQIPFQMQKYFGYRSQIVCRQNEERYNYLDRELQGLDLRFIKTSPLLFLLKHATEIDVLMLFHVKTESIYATLLYKLLNPAGIVYVKYDLPDKDLLYAAWGNRNLISQFKRNLLFKLFVRKLDIFSVECRQVYDALTRIPAAKKIHIPNGFDPGIAACYGVTPKRYEEKENIILLVGRHGSRQKNSELILQVLERIRDIGDWQLFFIGPMTDEFRSIKNAFLDTHPHYREKIHFPGNISDKKVLFEYYNRAKIFCLPSRWEGFPLVGPEALYFGNVLVMTREVEASHDLTGDDSIGFRAASENVTEWSETLNMLLHDQELLSNYSQRAQVYFSTNLVWKNILQDLHSRIVATKAASLPF